VYLSRYKKHTEHQVYCTRKEIPHNIIIKTQNVQDKERLLKAARGQDQLIYKDRPTKLISDFPIETLKAKRAWISVVQTQREHREKIPASPDHCT
jgi:3-methyladenine DNA glycosylase Mpg